VVEPKRSLRCEDGDDQEERPVGELEAKMADDQQVADAENSRQLEEARSEIRSAIERNDDLVADEVQGRPQGYGGGRHSIEC
jgi:hypothetical protein